MTTRRTARVWLDVPFSEKGTAKAAGARWEPRRRQWYAPEAAVSACARWVSRGEVPDLLPGEDRAFGAGLFVDMVPTSCWFTNVRSCVEPTDWDRLRRMVYRRAHERCEVCGQGRDAAAGIRLEAHERWSYDEATTTQALRRLIALCSPCHTATHFGLAQLRGLEDQARWQLRAVNGWSEVDVDLHIEGTVEQWYARSTRTWVLDLGMLTCAGVGVRKPPEPGTRAAVATRQVRQSAAPAP